MSLPTHEINFAKPPTFGELPEQMFEGVHRALGASGSSYERGLWERDHEQYVDPLVAALRPLIEAISAEDPAAAALSIEVFRGMSLPGGNKTGRSQEWHYDGDIYYDMTADSITTRQLYIPDSLSEDEYAEAIATIDAARVNDWYFNQSMIEEGIKNGLYAIAQSRPRQILTMKNAIHQEPTNRTQKPIARTFIRAEVSRD